MERRNRNILIVLIGLVIVVAVAASFGLPLFAGPTPTITLPTAQTTDSVDPGEDAQEDGVRVEVTPATVQSVIAVLSRLESYYRTVSTTLEDTTLVAQVWVDGGWTRADLPLPSGFVAHTIVGDGTLWRWYGEETAVASWAADSASVDIEGQRIPTYEDVLALDPNTITAAGYEEKNSFPCVYVEVSVPQLDQVERYWVSADNGLLVAAETETGGRVVYAMSASAPEVPVPTSASFTLPDGTVLHTVGETAP